MFEEEQEFNSDNATKEKITQYVVRERDKKTIKNTKNTLFVLSSRLKNRIGLIIIALAIFISFNNQYFLILNNLLNLVESVAILSILAFGVTFVLLIEK
ncbi:MAG: hypothetical protein U5N58_00995 [Actinomycetota bacterium]|nr:hypothetical protein [Actinomycetota bacterium]